MLPFLADLADLALFLTVLLSANLLGLLPPPGPGLRLGES